MDKSSNVNGSNPSIGVAGSSPSLSVSGSNPSMSIQASNPAFKASAPSLRVQYSEQSLSSISVVRRSSSKAFLIGIASLLAVTLVVLAVGVVYILNEAKAQKVVKAQKEQDAKAVKFVNAQLTRQLEDFGAGIEAEETTILMNLFTTPEGADVYEEGVFIGKTPIEDKKYDKSLENHDLVIVLDGYEIERRQLDLEVNFSETIELSPEVVDVPKVHVSAPVAAEKPQEGGIVANQARVVGASSDGGEAKKKTKKKDKAESAAPAPQFVLPE